MNLYPTTTDLKKLCVFKRFEKKDVNFAKKKKKKKKIFKFFILKL